MYLPSEPSSEDNTFRSISPLMHFFPSPPNSDFELPFSPLRETYSYLEPTNVNNSGEYNFLTYSFSNLTLSENDNSSDNLSLITKFKIPKIIISAANSYSTEEQSEEAEEESFANNKTNKLRYHTNLSDLEKDNNQGSIGNIKEEDLNQKEHHNIKNKAPNQITKKTTQGPITKLLLLKPSLKKERDNISSFSPNYFLQNQPVSKFFMNNEIKKETGLNQEILISPNEGQFENVKNFENVFDQMVKKKGSHFKPNCAQKKNKNFPNRNKIKFLSPTTIVKTKTKTTTKTKTRTKTKIKTKTKTKTKSTRRKFNNNYSNLSNTLTTSPLSVESSNLIQDYNENSSINKNEKENVNEKGTENRNGNKMNYSQRPKTNVTLGLRKRPRRRSSRRSVSSNKHISKSFTPIKSELSQSQYDLQSHTHPKSKSTTSMRNKENGVSRQNKHQTIKVKNSERVKLGKSIYKVLIGTLWVILGCTGQTQISPYSQKFGDQISMLLKVSKPNINSAPLVIKNLLSNSRRTFAEFILEILIGVLSLCSLNDPPKRSLQLKETLREIAFFKKRYPNKEILTKNLKCCGNEKQMELINKLNDLYHEIFVEDILMFWFEKRFIKKTGLRLPPTQRTKFFSQYILVIGNYCFQRCCNLLAEELTKECNDNIASQYFRLINSPYQLDPLNCYFNHRMGKMKLITRLIVKFSVNKGEYWDEIANDFSKKIDFNLDNILQTYPFNFIMDLPLIQKNVQIQN
ncbi:hypothetical protein M0812_03457 [Anaeramoeba flamelloides]|uniref:Uncharacterized protein n=1 Tax=Anaeramoeba flamelloides TaxID=1746091 RepID=A0AAV8AHN1_9EUKA|nr:hypothetical protein M0812_03457 [Anaeramoeba flamelloides]